MPWVWQKCQRRVLVLVVGSVTWLFCSLALADIDYEALKKGVVKITTDKETGAGIVVGIDNGGASLIVTAWHVVADAKDIQVEFRGSTQKFSGRSFRERNETLDLAVVIVDPQSGKSTPQNLSRFSCGDVETLTLGADVSAIGHPAGENWKESPLAHKIQALRDPYDSRLFRFTRQNIDRGSSGGPVFDSNGHLLGMVTEKVPPYEVKAVKISEIVNFLGHWGLNADLLVSIHKKPTPNNEPVQRPVPPQNPPSGWSSSESAPPPGMVQVPAGEFFMGCNEKVDTECFDNEKPGRTVNLPGFSIDKTEVSVADYKKCMDAGKCTQPDTGSMCNWGVNGRKNHPVNCVDWAQAKAFCKWVGKRLPTEAEWEKAARGTDGRVYPWGNRWEGKKANVEGEYDGPGYTVTAPVGSFADGASRYGALDMAGNVWEWTADWSDKEHKYRSVRGGSWDDNRPYARASTRSRDLPDTVAGRLGFRCAQ